MANGRSGRTPAKDSLFGSFSSEAIAERKRKEREAFSAKADEATAKRKAEREAKAAKRKAAMEEAQARRKPRDTSLPQGAGGNPKGKMSSDRAKGNRAKAEEAGRLQRESEARRNRTASPAVGGTGKAAKTEAKTEEKKPLPKFGVGKEFTIRGGKANVTADQLKKTGLTQAQYMKQWRATNKRPTAATAKKGTTTSATSKAAKKVGPIRRLLLGSDGKFGGARGAIDFLPGKSRPKKKAMGGMMKSKMASKGGARGGRRAMGMKAGGFPDLNKDGKVTQADILQGRGVAKKKAGGMAKKGYANGGMASAAKTIAGKTTRSRNKTKPRGVGAALRGYGKATRR